MASGLNGQRFAFHGYLPQQSGERIRKIRQLEEQSRKESISQIFIETPYRNHQLFADLKSSLNPSTRLCLAISLTGPEERVITKTVAEWKKITIEFQKQPAVFLFLS
jgi:16S rRNA (cytidine1402-2'-O)-methyltransferase